MENKTKFLSVRKAELRSFNKMLANTERDSGTSVARVDHSKGPAQTDLNRDYVGGGLKSMLERKNY